MHACIYIASTHTTVHGLSTCVNQANKHYGYNEITLQFYVYSSACFCTNNSSLGRLNMCGMCYNAVVLIVFIIMIAKVHLNSASYWLTNKA